MKSNSVLTLRRTPRALVAWQGGIGFVALLAVFVWLLLAGRDGWDVFDSVFLSIFGAVALQWLTGAVRLLPRELRAGGIFYKRRVARDEIVSVMVGDVNTGRWVTDGIVLKTTDGRPDIALSISGGLTFDRRMDWLKSIETWLEHQHESLDGGSSSE